MQWAVLLRAANEIIGIDALQKSINATHIEDNAFTSVMDTLVPSKDAPLTPKELLTIDFNQIMSLVINMNKDLQAQRRSY